jgi:uncharacterized protein YjbI with pentapeptide repeats
LWLSRKILSGREIDHSRRRLAAWAWSGLGLALSLGVVLFSIAVVTFPGELQEGRLPMSWAILPAMDEWGELRTTKDTSGNPRPASLWDWIVNARHLSVHDWLFVEERDQVTRRRFPFSSTLVLPGLNIYEGLGIDDPEKAKWHDFVFRARGRDLSGAIFDLASLPKVDFTGAQLQGASFSGAQLQGASLENAQLQGAVLLGAQLQSASLNYAQLQGAVVTFAQLQGASLENAQLQGASARVAQLQGAVLIGAQLQGASLNGAQLQGASLKNAQLQGASLDGARLQGASLDGAQLQGASLSAAALDATDLSDAWLWRTNAPSLPKPAAIRLADASWEPSWNDAAGIPHTWDDKAYQDLRKTIEAVRPRDAALGTVSRLDCASSDNSLASCDHDTKAPPEAAAWREALEAASVSDGAYSEALAKTLKGLVCSGGADAIHVVRGRGLLYRLHDCGVAAYDLVSVLTNKDSKDCPVAAALTDADRATLLMIKQGIEVDNATQKSAPSDTPQSP